MALERFLLLLPLLTILVTNIVSSETPAERFERQHVDSDHPDLNDNKIYCNLMMRNRGMTKGNCKQFNTFILESIWKIRAICWKTKAPCKTEKSNCYSSKKPMQVIECRLKGNSKFPRCKYQTMKTKKHIIVACHGWPPLPVHLDYSKKDKGLEQ